MHSQNSHRGTLSLPDSEERQIQRAEALKALRREDREDTELEEKAVERNQRVGGFKAKRVEPSAPKGHEAFLKALETSGACIQVEKASSGNVLTGTVRHSDKYTISLVDADGKTHVIFKHDISEFVAISPRASDKADK